METTTSSELEIPETARHAATEALLDSHDPIEFAADTVDVVLDVAARVIVAAELRRLLEQPATFRRGEFGRAALLRQIRGRAEELDPQTP